MKKTVLVSVLALCATSAHATVIDFDELNPVDRPLYGNATPTQFTSKGAVFHKQQWSGWTYSNDNDTTTPGFTNQYAAFTGTDLSGTGNYGIVFGSGPIDLPAGQTPQSVYVTNTTYAALSMLQGDSFAKKFGGPTGDDPDYFEVTFIGFSGPGASGSVTGSTTFRLADYTFVDNNLDYVVSTWELVDLTPLGNAASIDVAFASTDVGTFGINTPTYVAIDNLTLVPEPMTAAMLAIGACLVGMPRRRA